MKILISTIVAAIVMFLIGGLFYGLLFSKYFAGAYANVMRPGTDYHLWAIFLANLIQAFVLSVIYARFFSAGNGTAVANGMTYGFWMGVLICAPYPLFMWAGMNVSWKPAVLDGVISFIIILIGCITISLVQKRSRGSETVTTTSSEAHVV
jgi:hypothetical protein